MSASFTGVFYASDMHAKFIIIYNNTMDDNQLR